MAVYVPLVRGGSLAGLIADYGALLSVRLLSSSSSSSGRRWSALDAVHGADWWVHRDVKPANLLLECLPGLGRADAALR